LRIILPGSKHFRLRCASVWTHWHFVHDHSARNSAPRVFVA
jgi:hypothetical protein